MVSTIILSFTILHALTMAVALVGNTLLIYIVWNKPATRSLTSFLFVNMAVADLLTTCFLMPTTLAHFYSNNMTDSTCGFIFYAGLVSATASIFCLTIMAFDRYFAVAHPFRQSLWFRKPKIIMPIVWISSMALMSMAPVVFKSNHGMCSYDMIPQPVIPLLVFWTYILVITFILPLAIITILYSIVIGKLWLHRTPLEHETSPEQDIPKKRIIRMLVIIVVVFTVCWLPMHVYQMEAAVYAYMVYWPEALIYFCYWFSQANSAINPWLYIGMNGKMKAAFTRMILCRPEEYALRGNNTTITSRRSRASSTKGSFLMDTRL